MGIAAALVLLFAAASVVPVACSTPAPNPTLGDWLDDIEQATEDSRQLVLEHADEVASAPGVDEIHAAERKGRHRYDAALTGLVDALYAVHRCLPDPPPAGMPSLADAAGELEVTLTNHVDAMLRAETIPDVDREELRFQKAVSTLQSSVDDRLARLRAEAASHDLTDSPCPDLHPTLLRRRRGIPRS